MQVSWIDVDNLNALLARIAPQAAPEAPLPVMPPASVPEPAGQFMMNAEEEPAPLSTVVDEDDPPEEEAPLPYPEAALPLSKIRDKLRSIRQRANEAGILAKPEMPAASRLAALASAAGGQQERLAAFGSWARQVLREDGGHVLVMNDDGELLWGGDAKAGLVLSAMMAWSATQRGSAHAAACQTAPVVRQALASGHTLTVIPCVMSTGVLYHAAVAGPAALSDEVAGELRKALVRTMEAA